MGMNKNAVVAVDRSAGHYAQMITAINECHATDDCKDIADRSIALAAYYKQAKDDDALRKVNEIKLRAARRMGQIWSERCATLGLKLDAKGVRDAWGDDPTTSKTGDGTIRLYLALAALGERNFNDHINEANGRIRVMLEIADPSKAEAAERLRSEAIERRERMTAAGESIERLYPSVRPDDDRKFERLDEENAKLKEALAESEAELGEAHERFAEVADVGFTLDTRQRKRLRAVAVLLNVDAHDQLRLAAFNSRRTMWSIAREALDMWFAANGYKPIAYHDPSRVAEAAE